MENSSENASPESNKTPKTSRRTAFWRVMRDGPDGLVAINGDKFDRQGAEKVAKQMANDNKGDAYFAVRVGKGFVVQEVTEVKTKVIL